MPARAFGLAPPRVARQRARVEKLCIFTGTTLAGYAGWYLAEAAGLGFFGCFLFSGAGSIAGVWLGWKLARRLR